MRVAVVDVGTNSTRLLIAELEHGTLSELERDTTVTRLGSGVDANGRLEDAAIERVNVAIAGYMARIDHHGCERRVAVMTSAVRDAANGADFVEQARERFGLDARAIDGEEEARLTFRGAMSDRAGGPPTLVIDVGGGSTELIVGAAGEVTFHVSLQAGVVRQSERHLHHDPPHFAELNALRADVRSTICDGVPRRVRRAARGAIAVGGTATSLAAIDQGLEPYDPECVHGYRLERSTCLLLLARLAALPEAERGLLAGLHPDRATTIVAGSAILVEALAAFGLESFEASEHDILRGVAMSLARG